MRVVINSSGRAELLAERALPLLRRAGIEPEVWVSSELEKARYARFMDCPLFVAPHDPADKRLEVVGVEPVGLGKARNTVIQRAAGGEHLVFIDDDVTGVAKATDPRTLERVDDLGGLFQAMFREADAASATLWGLYPVANAYFMRPRLRYGLSYIVGALFGVIVTGSAHELVTLDDKEDFERSIRHYLANGVVVRSDRHCIQTTGYYTTPGGMQQSRTPERVRVAAEWLAARYPDLCTLNTGKRSPWAEVKLADRRPVPTASAPPASASARSAPRR